MKSISGVKTRTCFSVLMVNLILFLVFVEIMGLAHYWREDDQLYYARPSKVGESSPVQEFTNFVRHQISPYFGYIRRPGLPMSEFFSAQRLQRLGLSGSAIQLQKISTNNHGFFAGQDYPIGRTDDNQMFIAVVGGSVAQFFALQGKRELIENLKTKPEFRGREIVLLNFANGGYKQPQQLMIINFYLAIGQPLDWVINIDGFNEVVIANRNREYGYHPAMPNARRLDRLAKLSLSSQSEQEFLHNARFVELSRQTRQVSAGRQQCWLASCELYWFTRSVWLRRQLEQLDRDFPNSQESDSSSLLSIYQGIGEQQESVLAIWERSSAQLRSVLAGLEIGYLHVIQPNQYHTQHPFDSPEDALALAKDSPFEEAVARGYPEL